MTQTSVIASCTESIDSNRAVNLKPSTLGDAIGSYVLTLSDAETKNFYTAILKYTLPEFNGLDCPSNSRITSKQRKKLLAFCDHLPFADIYTLLAKQEKYFEKIKLPESSRYSYVSRLKKFVEYYAQDLEDDGFDSSVFKTKHYKRHYKTTDRKAAKIHALPSYNDEIMKDIALYDKFLRTSLDVQSETRRARYIKSVKMFLGMACKDKNINPDELALTDVVPFVDLKVHPLNIDDEDIFTRFAVEKLRAEYQCKAIATELCEWLEETFAERNLRPSSAMTDVDCIITIAKYIYKNHTDKYMYSNYEDVPVLIMLRQLTSKYNKLTKEQKKLGINQNINGKLVSWEEVRLLLEKARKKYDQDVYGDGKSVVPIQCKAKHLARFLMLGFLVLMPPDRQGTVRNLVLGKTLRFGFYDEHNNFTDASEMKSQYEAKFYIRLGKREYKTWRTYGEWIGEIPNKKFANGRHFYDYIREWLFDGYYDIDGKRRGLRDFLNENNVEKVFFGLRAFKEMDESAFGKIIKQMFYGEYAKPTTPHTLRHIYDTHIRAIGLDSETLKSIAYWMKHDEKVAEESYTHLTRQQKLNLACKAMTIGDLH